MLSPEQARNIAAGLALEARAAAEVELGEVWDTTLLPSRIGEYNILRVIAGGGMGTVYEAEQDSPRRIVALKVLKRDLVSRTALRRFRYETEVLARLHHPGIAQIYDAGTHDDGLGGVPYFAMEYVRDALPITRYADDRQLDVRARLELFAQTCDAVNHGHQNRIIHRDLKPANILVDQHGAVKIIDFGIACATDADVTLTTLHTDSRAIIGTLQYMSPEQATGGGISPSLEEGGQGVREALDPRNDHSPLSLGEGPPGTGVRARTATSSPDTPLPQPSPRGRGIETAALDTRTDIYSLGVILYELVCGQLPYDLSGSSITQATRIIEQADPPRPTAIWRERRKLPVAGDVIPLGERAPHKPPLPLGEGRGQGATKSPSPSRARQEPALPPGEGAGTTLPLPLGEGRGEGASESPSSSGPNTTSSRRHRARAHDIRSPRALEAIILKAMSKDRRRRYQTAAALVDDVRRYLNGEPVEAKPPSKWMRATRWVGRHPRAAAAMFCIMIAAITTATTLIAIDVLQSMVPLRFDQFKPGDSVVLLRSITGRAYDVLGGGQDSHVIQAFTAIRPDEFGGGRMAFYSVLGTNGKHLTDGQLYMAPIDDLGAYIWRTRGDSSFIRTPEPFYSHNHVYNINVVLLADVFPDSKHPGEEIIVSHISLHHPGSPCAIRVYNWNLEVLFEAWHLGPVRGFAWLPESALLICAAERHCINWVKANDWVRANQPEYPFELAQGDYPMVLFALQPSLNGREGWIEPRPQASAPSLRWYQCVLPLTYRLDYDDDRVRNSYGLSHIGVVSKDAISVTISLRNMERAGIGLQIDGRGILVTRDPSDRYRTAETAGEVDVPSSAFRLGDMPNIGETTEETKARWERDRSRVQD